MTMQRRILTGLMLISILIANISAISAQEYELKLALCILENNTLVLALDNSETCKQYVTVDVPFMSSKQMFQFLRAIQDDIYGTLRAQGLITPDNNLQGELRDNLVVPSIPNLNPLMRSTMTLPSMNLPFPPQMAGAAVIASRGGVAVSVTQQNGGPAHVTVQSDGEQRSFTVDGE